MTAIQYRKLQRLHREVVEAYTAWHAAKPGAASVKAGAKWVKACAALDAYNPT